MNQERIAGAAVSTPLSDELAIDHDRLVDHVMQPQQRGIDMFTLFGTIGEGTSFSRVERAEALERCRAAGIGATQLGMGVFGLSSHDAGEDSKAAFASGCGHVLLAPPCFYKGVDDEGLYRWFSEVIETSGPNSGHFLLYHIPALTQVELSSGTGHAPRHAIP
jgi:4-hydroxy-tetrahydrodipicolinate synthase